MSARKCASCLGEGWQLLLNSWFMGDGYRRERCGICAGTSRSAYPAWPGTEKFQREARVRQAAMQAHLKAHPAADYIELGRIARDAA